MLEFIKRNILIISISVMVTLVMVGLVWFMMSSNQPQPVSGPASDIPAEVIAGNNELNEDERKAAIYALDFIYSYGNYEAPNHFFTNLEGNVTDDFKVRVEQIRRLVESPGSNLYSNLVPSKENYVVTINQEGARSVAEASFQGVLSNNQVKQKSVTVKVRMVKENNYWLLDNVQIQ